jgi:flagellar hook assembly protein FlgD
LPNDFIIQKPFPNPFNPATTFRFELAQSGFVRLVIYNVLGRRVKVLINETMHQGLHSIIWDGTNTRGDIQSAGVFLYRLQYGGKSESGKLLLLK